MMTLTFDPALEAMATASSRIALRDALARILQDVIPDHVTVYGVDLDFFRSDACDAAERIVEELDARGFAIGRAA